ncbi:MAG: PAS domain-containing protein [Opitutaceae bacterium]
MKQTDLQTSCSAILLDLRTSSSTAKEAIDYLADRKGSVAFICLCQDHSQLDELEDVIHLIDDYILEDQLTSVELSTRIKHAIRRRRRKHELLSEQNLLRALLDTIPDAIYFKDLNSKFIKVNAAMAGTYDDSKPDQLVGKSDFDLFTKEHAQPAYDDEQRIIETGEPLIGKIEKETLADGSIQWVTTTKLPLRDKNHAIIGTMGISRSVTDLKETQEALFRETALLKTIVNNALAGIYVKDRQGRYIVINDHHARYLGAQASEECLQKTLKDFQAPEVAEKAMLIDEKIMQTGEGLENMVSHRTNKNGETDWLLTTKVPVFNDSGECIGLVGISQDITQQKKNELKLKSTIQTLEDTKLQLIEAEKLKTIGRLAAGIAHEIKNPLSVVLLGIEFLISQKDQSQDIQEILKDMQQAVLKANDVVFELLDYSSPHDLSLVPTQINETIEQALSLMRHNIRKAHVQLIDERSEGLPNVYIDPSKIDQVFINLILNALSVMPEGGDLIVRTYTKRMREAGSNVSSEMTEHFRIGDTIVVVEIIDTGTGIEEANQSKVFDPFFSTNATGEGTGLGLSVTRGIVDMHRGMITLRNRDDAKGACAQILFPTQEDQKYD